MAKARIIIKRRKAVRNIKKITKVMQMIATSRYQKAFKRAIGAKPYVQKIAKVLGSVVQALEAGEKTVQHPLLRPSKAGVKKTAVLVLTSNRGLAGGYNGNVLRRASHTLATLESNGDTPELHVSGKKGIAYFRFQKRPMKRTYTTIGDNPTFADIDPLAEEFMRAYINGEITALKIVYMQFISPGQQRPVAMDVLPLSNLADKAKKGRGGCETNFEFLPSVESLLEELIPKAVKISVFQAFMESAVSEQIARMIAMKAATDNAEKMGKKLTQDYNRARQSQITSELSELMGGVEAMK